jgi:hypothetical protein
MSIKKDSISIFLTEKKNVLFECMFTPPAPDDAKNGKKEPIRGVPNIFGWYVRIGSIMLRL